MASSSVLVIGAGLIGSSISWRLAQAGIVVTLADAGAFGGECSAAGAGMLSPGGEFEKPSHWLDLGIESMRMYPDFVRELESESGATIDFKRCGCVNFTEPDRARSRAQLQSGAGIQVELRDDGLFYPGDAYVDPGDLLRALRKVCMQRGVRIAERKAIDEVESTDHRAVVIAAGAWSSRIRVQHSGAQVPLPQVEPVKGHLIGFQLEPESLGPMLRRGHTYILQRATGFTIAGSTEEHAGFDRTVNAGTCEEIHRAAAQLWPALDGKSPCARWIGFRPHSEDGPHIRRVEGTNVWLAYGHFRNGILLTPLTSTQIGGEIIESYS
jgi:glycine oxidase